MILLVHSGKITAQEAVKTAEKIYINNPRITKDVLDRFIMLINYN